MSDATTDPFSPEISAAVTAHMNGDHIEDNLLIARSLGGQPEATAAVMTGVGPQGAAFDATVDGAPVAFTVPWQSPITDRGAIRVEVVRMYHEACEQLGVAPRQAGEH